MTTRRLMLAHRHVAMAICIAVLLLKLIVPGGYMFASDHGRITVTICSGLAPRTMVIEVPMAGDEMPGHGQHQDQGKSDSPCVFAGLTGPALSAADAIQIAALVLFILTLWRMPHAPAAPAQQTWLRPPLRGPPATL